MNGIGSFLVQSESNKRHAKLLICEQLGKLPVDKIKSMIKRLSSICEVEVPSDLGAKLILSWKEVKEMEKAGINFGAHSVNHPILTKIPLEDSKKEIVKSINDKTRAIVRRSS